MFHGKRIAVVMPAYNAGKTLEKTYKEIPLDIVDDVILVDDGSRDDTVAVAKGLGIHTIVHVKNRGYGGNQKTCYKSALERNADVVVMLHPDYQYDPRLIAPMCGMIIDGPYDAVIGSRILGGSARKGGMPLWKYVSNRFLTLFENLMLDAKLSEYHTGYRAFRRSVLEKIDFEKNSEDFVFDSEFLAQCILAGFSVGEISCPAKYFAEASSINFSRSVKYGFGVLRVSIQGFFARMGMAKPALVQRIR